MGKEFFQKLIDNKITDFYSGEPDFMLLSRYKHLVKDALYFDFLTDSHNGGFFYKQSLHIYSYSHNRDFNDIEQVNNALKAIYGDLVNGLESFGQDLFGNQFCFDTVNNNRIVFFNTETGRREDMAADFGGWIEKIYQHFGYYIGLTLMNEWRLRNSLGFNQRLCPKLPFISSGDFSAANLCAGNFPEYLENYASIARQVHHLPEGTTVKVVVHPKKLNDPL
jgi:hypothetical protein